MKIPVTRVTLYLNSKYQPDGKPGITNSFQTIADADEFLKSQHTIEHWVFEVHWEDSTSQKGHLYDKQMYVSQWLRVWADRMINGPKEAPEDQRKEFVRQTLELQPKIVKHAHKLLNELELD